MPVTPDTYQWTVGKRIETININALGDVYRPGGMTRFSGNRTSYSRRRIIRGWRRAPTQSPQYYLDYLNAWAADGKVIRMVITGTEINTLIYIEDVTQSEKDGTGDRYVTVAIREYCDLRQRKWPLAAPRTTVGQTMPPPPEKTQSYTIVSGDTLSVICRRYYGKSSAKYYNALAKYNGIKNPHLIYPGVTIQVPSETVLLGDPHDDLSDQIKSGTRDITDILTYWTWSGDKSTISRQLTGEVAYIENSQLPVPEIGDLVTMTDGGEKKFVGIVLQRSLGSEDSTMAFTAFDYGYYLQRNDGTYKFTGATPEEMTRLACADRGIPIAQMPHTGIPLRRKFTGVKLNQLITTAWTLASEKNGKVYAIRYTPRRPAGEGAHRQHVSLVLKAASNLMNATTKGRCDPNSQQRGHLRPER